MSSKSEMARTTRGAQIWSAVTHGVGVLFSFIALILLLLRAESVAAAACFMVFCSCMALMYLASTLYHSLFFTKVRAVFQRIDHSTIYLCIAGCYTPVASLYIGGRSGLILLVAIWALALVGVLGHVTGSHYMRRIELPLFLIMGWLVVIFMRPFYQACGGWSFACFVAGGIVYSLGALIYKQKHRPYAHVWWHFFVLLGSVLIFMGVYLNS